MGEIIQFDFNKDRKKTDDLGVPEVKNENEENKIEINDIFFKKFANFVLSDRHKKFKNLEFKQMPYNEAKKLVSSYTNEQLVNWIVDSNESEWVVRPSFYMAIYNEIKSRLPERFNK